jgi:hypothetical protein
MEFLNVSEIKEFGPRTVKHEIIFQSDFKRACYSFLQTLNNYQTPTAFKALDITLK